jgi:16S rRNA (guanine527-N7)-methyltransferase
MTDLNLDELQASARSLLGLRLGRRELDAFRWYAGELLAWNERFNLTAITDPVGIEMKHFLDSLTCALALRPSAGDRLVDVGTGAGFPGIPLKIAFPKLQLTLIESVGKKAEFCEHIVEGLGLADVVVVHARAEDVGRDPVHRQTYDWGVARAVAQLAVVSEYLMPLLRIGGRAITQKGETGPAEAQAAAEALSLLGAGVEAVVPVELPRVPESRYLIVLHKRAATPETYPRRAGMPGRRPLG